GLVALGGVWWLTSTPAPVATPDSTRDHGNGPDAVHDPQAAAVTTTGPARLPDSVPPAEHAPTPELPASLANTEFDGSVELDANGQLRLTASLRRLFDYALSSIGERSIEEIRALLSAQLDTLTSSDGKRQAMAAFERYVRYLQAVDQAAATLAAMPLEQRLQAMMELRRQQLGGEMADAFFADEEAYQRFTLDRRALSENAALSADERAAREHELLAELPESVREPYLAQLRTEADLADSAAIDTLASDPDERHRLRRERFGEEAAARMELLDRERAAWDARVAAYRAERTRVQSLDAATRQAALDAWLQRNFDEAEQRRIRSLEGIGEI
ncbi:MAG TPA: lipase secretion chaperone, partial [Xanthomonadales bacterium]|nr:lipase secretion chaperone [Xanthomonadales bacterium]